MNKLGMIAIFGMLMAVLGRGVVDSKIHLFEWGLALCISVLVHWVNSLQKQVDELKSKVTPGADKDAGAMD